MNKYNKYNKGQSLIDLVFSVGIIILVLSGVVVLMVNSVSTKTKGFDRKTASRMAEVVMERMVAARDDDPVGFFGQPSAYVVLDQSLSEFHGYLYSIDFGVYDSASCSTCRMVTVTVRWTDKTPQTFVLNRIFSRI